MIAFLGVPLIVPEAYLLTVLAIAMVAFVLPFTEGGVCITLLLTRLPYGGGWLYAADLAGAALGCLGVIFVLLVVDPVSATLWIGAVAAGAGWIVARGADDARSLRLSGAVALILAFAAAAHTGLAASGRTHLGVFWAKGHQQTGTLFERWNTYSRVRVTALGETTPFGWGFAHAPQTKIDQDYLDIDADASTVITRQSGDIGKLSYLKDDVINAAYWCSRPQTSPSSASAAVGTFFRPSFSAPGISAESRSIPRFSKSSPTSSPISPAISIGSPACRWSMRKPAATSTIRQIGSTLCRSR